MNQIIAAACFTIFLFGGILALLEIGRRWGRRRLEAHPGESDAGLGAIDGAVFALLGLLIAFTFSGAASRFETRRNLIVEEANDIGTAWLRLDLLPATAQPALRESFRNYVDARLEVYAKIEDPAAATQAFKRSNAIQGDIWAACLAATREGAAPAAPMLLLPALNQMFDITTTRTVALRTHPPIVIFVLLAVVALICALLAGHGMAGSSARSWVHMIGFAAITAGAVYVILDLEYPRLGLIRIDAADHVLVDLRQSMN